MESKDQYILRFREAGTTAVAMIGGKGANLASLSKLKGIHVPDGFCVTTNAFKKVVDESAPVNPLIDQLSSLTVNDRDKIREVSRQIRETIENAAIPNEITGAIINHLTTTDASAAYAIRSSATAEDLPTASFAGQQDTYLNIIEKEAILQHIRNCWASLFTERAVIYRMQNGFDHRQVHLAVIVQEMVFPQASGILFTADPVTSNRKIISIDAGFGLGEAIVSGLVSADCYKVKDEKIIDKRIAAKKMAIYGLKEGGTETKALVADQQKTQTLNDAQILELARIGKEIEKHFGTPQDMEWCLSDDVFYIVQSRPITTLFPVPDAKDDQFHVYISVGHQQMMTDALKPLGLSVRHLTVARSMYSAAGRQFVDITQQLSSTAGRQNMVEMMGQSDPLTKSALLSLLERDDFSKPVTDEEQVPHPIRSSKGLSAGEIINRTGNDPGMIHDLIRRSETSIAELKANIQKRSGTELFDFILQDIQQLRQLLTDPKTLSAIMAVVNSSYWLNEKMQEWLGEKGVADVLTQSVPNNVTSEMGLELMDLADVIRPYPEIVAYLQQTKEDHFLDALSPFKGGNEVREAITAYLHKYGMRCAGEIDITRTRWAEKPLLLVPMLLNNIRNFEPGAGKRRFEQGLQEAMKKEKELLERLYQLPDREEKARETKQMIDLVRAFAGYREYPKYGIVSRYWIYKQALMKEAEQLVKANVIVEAEDVYYLDFEEFRETVRTQQLDKHLIGKRKEEHRHFEKLTPPRLMTSDGEILTGRYDHENLPAGAIAGLAVSAGIVEGRARVITDMETADLEEGDILVTFFTDPSWTPLFVSLKGLVTEVGGLMTHGAVIAREYGLPAVVGVENATKVIKDGQRIRVNGTEGFVEIL